MSIRFIVAILIILNLTNCGERKLEIIETKVISESEPYTKPDEKVRKMVAYRSSVGMRDLREETVRVYSSSDIINEIKELADGDRTTVWISGNDSRDDYFVFPIYVLIGFDVKRKDRLPYAIDILSGWAKNKKTHKMYNRPKRIRLELYEVPYYNAMHQYDESYIVEDEIRLVYSLVVELTDGMGWHRVKLNIKEEEYPTTIGSGRLVIEEVYSGINDLTAISEIRFVYRETNGK